MRIETCYFCSQPCYPSKGMSCNRRNPWRKTDRRIGITFGKNDFPGGRLAGRIHPDQLMRDENVADAAATQCATMPGSLNFADPNVTRTSA